MYIFKLKNKELNDNRFINFKIIEYSDENEIRKYICENNLSWYIIQTKNNVLRLQLQCFNFNKHCILKDTDDENYFILISVKNADLDERIINHMKFDNHYNCEI